MALPSGNIDVKFNLKDVKKQVKQLEKDFEKGSKDAVKELKNIEKTLLKNGQISKKMAAQERAINKSREKALAKVNLTEKQRVQINEAADKQILAARKQHYRMLERELDKHISKEKRLNKERTASFTAGIAGAAQAGMGGGLAGAVGGASRMFGPVGLAVASVTAAVGASIATMDSFAKKAREVEAGMAGIKTLLSPDKYKFLPEIQAQLERTAIQTGQTLDTLIQGTYQVLSAGAAQAENVGQFMQDVSKFAVGIKADVESSSLAVGQFLNAMGWGAERAGEAMDVMATTMRVGVIKSGQELAQYMPQIAGLMQNLGLSAEEYGAALASLTGQGTQISEAVTGLKALYTELKNVTTLEKLEAAGVKGIDYMNRTIASVDELAASVNSIDPNLINDALGSIEAKQALGKLFSGTNKDLFGMMKSFQDVGGAAGQMFRDIANTGEMEMQRTAQAMEAASRGMGRTWQEASSAINQIVFGLFASTQDKFSLIMQEVENVNMQIKVFQKEATKGIDILANYDETQAVDFIRNIEGQLEAIRSISPAVASGIEMILAQTNTSTEDQLKGIVDQLGAAQKILESEKQTKAIEAIQVMFAGTGGFMSLLPTSEAHWEGMSNSILSASENVERAAEAQRKFDELVKSAMASESELSAAAREVQLSNEQSMHVQGLLAERVKATREVYKAFGGDIQKANEMIKSQSWLTGEATAMILQKAMLEEAHAKILGKTRKQEEKALEDINKAISNIKFAIADRLKSEENLLDIQDAQLSKDKAEQKLKLAQLKAIEAQLEAEVARLKSLTTVQKASIQLDLERERINSNISKIIEGQAQGVSVEAKGGGDLSDYNQLLAEAEGQLQQVRKQIKEVSTGMGDVAKEAEKAEKKIEDMKKAVKDMGKQAADIRFETGLIGEDDFKASLAREEHSYSQHLETLREQYGNNQKVLAAAAEVHQAKITQLYKQEEYKRAQEAKQAWEEAQQRRLEEEKRIQDELNKFQEEQMAKMREMAKERAELIKGLRGFIESERESIMLSRMNELQKSLIALNKRYQEQVDKMDAVGAEADKELRRLERIKDAQADLIKLNFYGQIVDQGFSASESLVKDFGLTAGRISQIQANTVDATQDVLDSAGRFIKETFNEWINTSVLIHDQAANDAEKAWRDAQQAVREYTSEHVDPLEQKVVDIAYKMGLDARYNSLERMQTAVIELEKRYTFLTEQSNEALASRIKLLIADGKSEAEARQESIASINEERESIVKQMKSINEYKGEFVSAIRAVNEEVGKMLVLDDEQIAKRQRFEDLQARAIKKQREAAKESQNIDILNISNIKNAEQLMAFASITMTGFEDILNRLNQEQEDFAAATESAMDSSGNSVEEFALKLENLGKTQADAMAFVSGAFSEADIIKNIAILDSFRAGIEAQLARTGLDEQARSQFEKQLVSIDNLVEAFKAARFEAERFQQQMIGGGAIAEILDKTADAIENAENILFEKTASDYAKAIKGISDSYSETISGLEDSIKLMEKSLATEELSVDEQKKISDKVKETRDLLSDIETLRDNEIAGLKEENLDLDKSLGLYDSILSKIEAIQSSLFGLFDTFSQGTISVSQAVSGVTGAISSIASQFGKIGGAIGGAFGLVGGFISNIAQRTEAKEAERLAKIEERRKQIQSRILNIFTNQLELINKMKELGIELVEDAQYRLTEIQESNKEMIDGLLEQAASYDKVRKRAEKYYKGLSIFAKAMTTFGHVLAMFLDEAGVDRKIAVMVDKMEDAGIDLNNVTREQLLDFYESIDDMDVSEKTKTQWKESTMAILDSLQAVIDAQKEIYDQDKANIEHRIKMTGQELKGTKDLLAVIEQQLSARTEDGELLYVGEERNALLESELDLQNRILEIQREITEQYNEQRQIMFDMQDLFGSNIRASETLITQITASLGTAISTATLNFEDLSEGFGSLKDALYTILAGGGDIDTEGVQALITNIKRFLTGPDILKNTQEWRSMWDLLMQFEFDVIPALEKQASIESDLALLQHEYNMGLMTEDEYNSKRIALLQNMLDLMVEMQVPESERWAIEEEIYKLQKAQTEEMTKQGQISDDELNRLIRKRMALLEEARITGQITSGAMQADLAAIEAQIRARLAALGVPSEDIDAMIQAMIEQRSYAKGSAMTTAGPAYIHDAEAILPAVQSNFLRQLSPGFLEGMISTPNIGGMADLLRSASMPTDQAITSIGETQSALRSVVYNTYNIDSGHNVFNVQGTGDMKADLKRILFDFEQKMPDMVVSAMKKKGLVRQVL